jgi:hypothetical protein
MSICSRSGLGKHFGSVAKLAASLIFVLIAGCGLGKKDPLVGVWKTSEGASTIFMTLRADGTFALTSSNAKETSDVFGRWKMKDETTVIFNSYASETAFEISVVSVGKDELNIRSTILGPSVLSFKLVSDTPQGPTNAEKFAATPEGAKQISSEAERNRIDKTVLNNLRQLSAAADQFYLETGATSAKYSDLVGPEPTKYVKSITSAANEIYPDRFMQGITLTVEGVAGARTITYAP